MQTLEDFSAPIGSPEWQAAVDAEIAARDALQARCKLPVPRVPPSALIRISTTEAELGRSLTAGERDELIKKLTSSVTAHALTFHVEANP